MSEIPYIPFFIDDYEGATAHLTVDEDGVYFRLIRLCWRTPGCSIPNDPTWIKRQMRVTDKQYKDIVAPIIKEFFKVKKGRVLQKRLQKEFAKAKLQLDARKKAGKKGGEAKALKDKEKGSSKGCSKKVANASGRHSIHTHTHTHLKIYKKENYSLRGDLPEGFQEFRKRYPKKKDADWTNGLDYFIDLLNEGVTVGQMIRGVEVSNFSHEERFIPHPKAFLKKRIWDSLETGEPIGDKWTVRIIGFLEKGNWANAFGPMPTIDGKPDGKPNQKFEAVKLFIKIRKGRK